MHSPLIVFIHMNEQCSFTTFSDVCHSTFSVQKRQVSAFLKFPQKLSNLHVAHCMLHAEKGTVYTANLGMRVLPGQLARGAALSAYLCPSHPGSNV